MGKRFFRSIEERMAAREAFEEKFAAVLQKMAEESSLLKMEDLSQAGVAERRAAA